jgi:NAD+ kinase
MNLFSKALVVYKPVNKCIKLSQQATTILRGRGVDIDIITIDDILYHATQQSRAKYDLVVPIGGDGTFMRVAKLYGVGSLILPIPCGKRNAFYEHISQPLDELIMRLFNGEYYLEAFPLFKVCYRDVCLKFINDVVLVSTDLGKVSKYRVQVESETSTIKVEFEGDGVIIASSYGSSGHSMSARGPLVLPEHLSLVVTPLNPLQLGIPSLVVSSLSIVRVWNKNPTVLYSDGDRLSLLDGGSQVEIKHSYKYIKVVRFLDKRDVWRSAIEPRLCTL